MPFSALAAEAEEELESSLQIGEVEREERNLGLDRYGSLKEGYDLSSFFRELLQSGLKVLLTPSLFRELCAVLLTLILCAVLKSVFPAQEGGLDVVTLAGAAAITLLLSGGQESALQKTQEALQRLRDSANVFLPSLSSAALLSGQVTGAAAKYASSAFFLNVLLNLCSALVLPVIRLYVAAAAAEAAAGGVMGSVLGFLRWIVVTALTCLMLAFTLFLSLTSLAVNSADAAVVRSVKTAISALLPVVGSIAGDAAASILAAAGVIRQAVGGFGLLAVTAVLFFPFFQAGLRCVLLKGISAVASALMDSRLGTLMKRLSEAMSLLAGTIAACALLLYFSIYSLIGAVTI